MKKIIFIIIPFILTVFLLYYYFLYNKGDVKEDIMEPKIKVVDGVTYINGSTYVTVSSEKVLPQNEWHHCAATLNGTTVKMYFDGELVKTETINWGTATIPTAARMELGVNFPGTDEKFTGCYSDARFYVTPLLDTDIKMLYNVSMKINNLGGIHTFKFEEATNEKLFKTGILQTNELEETSTQISKLKNNKGWLSPEFIEI